MESSRSISDLDIMNDCLKLSLSHARAGYVIIARARFERAQELAKELGVAIPQEYFERLNRAYELGAQSNLGNARLYVQGFVDREGREHRSINQAKMCLKTARDCAKMINLDITDKVLEIEKLIEA